MLPDGWRFSTSQNNFLASPDGKLYVGVVGEEKTNLDLAEAVWIYDIATGKQTGTIDLPNGEFSMDIDADGRRLFVANRFDRTLTIVDIASQTSIVLSDIGVDPSVVRAR